MLQLPVLSHWATASHVEVGAAEAVVAVTRPATGRAAITPPMTAIRTRLRFLGVSVATAVVVAAFSLRKVNVVPLDKVPGPHGTKVS